MSKKGLGKGLSGVFGITDTAEDLSGSTNIQTVKLSLVEPNKNQPRKTFDQSKIDALAASIKEHGIIQPLIVTKNGDMYTIVAGERRWRAAKAAGLSEVPVIVRDYIPGEIMEIALIENIQREDLNPIEEALGYKSLMEDYNLTQETVSERIGKSRSAIANTLRLLTLDEEIQQMLISGQLSSGHARAILSVNDKSLHTTFAAMIFYKHLSVRQAETEAKRINTDSKKENKKKDKDYVEKTPFEIELDNITHRLSSHLGTKVKISDNGKKGKIEIEYFGNEDLDRLLSIIGY